MVAHHRGVVTHHRASSPRVLLKTGVPRSPPAYRMKTWGWGPRWSLPTGSLPGDCRARPPLSTCGPHTWAGAAPRRGRCQQLGSMTRWCWDPLPHPTIAATRGWLRGRGEGVRSESGSRDGSGRRGQRVALAMTDTTCPAAKHPHRASDSPNPHRSRSPRLAGRLADPANGQTRIPTAVGLACRVAKISLAGQTKRDI